MSASFPAWVDSLGLGRAEFEVPGTPVIGFAEFLRETFDVHGAVSRARFEQLWRARQTEVARQAITVFRADLARTEGLNPTIEVRHNDGLLIISWYGNWPAPAMLAIRAPEAVCEVADNLRDHLVDDLNAAWPLCPRHGFGLYPELRDGSAAWVCRYADHVISVIGHLPSRAGSRPGAPSASSAPRRAARA